MAKRKAARATGRKAAGKRNASSRSKSGTRKSAARKGTAARKSAPSAARASGRTGTRKGTSKAASAKTGGRTSAARKSSARTASAAPKTGARKRAATKTVPLRKAPALDRARRTVQDDDIVPTPPSSLDLDRRASAARSGRRELKERFDAHTETSPALTGGDVDADWESAYSVGDEAPGGDNPTPDQDIVDDIGRAVGNEYQDTEELKGADKIAKRDKHRWELDPASSEDYDDRD
jgi:Family of unknown function (DUF6335)